MKGKKGFQKGNTLWKLNIGSKRSDEFKKKKSEQMKDFYKQNSNTSCGFQKGHDVFQGCEVSWFTTERMKGNTIRRGMEPWNKGMSKEELLLHYINGWKITHYSGKEHWNWQGGKSFEVYPREFKIIRKIILEIQPYCNICKTTENLVVHHIDKNKKNNNILNLVVLCRHCHGKVHYGGLLCV